MVRVSRCGESPFIPFEMADKRYRLLKEGHLDVKAPPDSPERILHKAWRRLWVRAIVFNPEGRGEPHFIMQLSRRAKDDEPMKHVKASRDGLRLFRCSSGSRALRCWALASGSTLLLYLAADTEKMTQEWMQTLREGLWPIVFTAHMPQEERHEVSLIDDEKSFASGLLGVYGRLVKTSEGMLSIIHPHWQGIQMRWRLDDIVDVKVLRTYDDSTDSGVFTLTVNSSGKDTRVLQFYSDTAIKTIDWIKSLLSNRNKSETKSHDIKPPVVSSHKGAEVIEENSETSSDAAQIDYAIVQKTKTNENLQEDTKSEKNDTSTNIHEEVNKEPEKLLLNIPRTFLNASTNNFQLIESESSTNGTGAMNQQGSEKDSDDSSNGSYDHLYEDLDLLKDSRAYTVYEEVDDGEDECEYIPPAPPVLPARLEQIKNQKVTKDDELNLFEFDPIINTSLQKSQIETQNIASAAVTEHQSKTSLSRQTSQKETEVSPADLRLQKLCESVSEALKIAEEPPPSPITPKRPSLLGKMVGKSKAKSHQASPPPEKARTPVQTNNATSLKRAVSESDLTEKRCDHKNLPLRPFENPKHVDNQGHRRKESKKQNHVPLEELLKNLKTKERRRQGHRRGVSDGGNIRYDYDKQISISQIQNEKKSSSVQAEDEYIDMS